MASDNQDDRRKQVIELMRRQKKHESHLKRQQRHEAKQLGTGQLCEDEERRRKVKELKRWLKQKDQEELLRREEANPMEKLLKAASKGHPMGKLEQDHREMRERRALIADQKRQLLDMSRAPMQLPQRVLHRHIHHHDHSHHKSDSYDQMMQTAPIGMRGGNGIMMQSASAGELSGGGSGAPTMGMPWRPMVHAASTGQIPAYGVTMPRFSGQYGIV